MCLMKRGVVVVEEAAAQQACITMSNGGRLHGRADALFSAHRAHASWSKSSTENIEANCATKGNKDTEGHL